MEQIQESAEETGTESGEAPADERGETENVQTPQEDEVLPSGSEENLPTENGGLLFADGQYMPFGEAADGTEDGLPQEEAGANAEDERAVVFAEGDIASGSYENVEWIIDASGKLTVSGTGDYAGPGLYGRNRSPWYPYRLEIISAEVNMSGMTNASYMFYGCKNLVSVDVRNFDTSEVTDMGSMFCGCYSLADIDVSHFSTTKVKNMSGMFFLGGDWDEGTETGSGYSPLEVLDVSNFDTTNVETMRYMFGGCTSLTNLEVGNFNTSNVTDMRYMFSRCSGLTELDLSSFDTSKVTEMGEFVWQCDSLQTIRAPRIMGSAAIRLPDIFIDPDGKETQELTADFVNMVLTKAPYEAVLSDGGSLELVSGALPAGLELTEDAAANPETGNAGLTTSYTVAAGDNLYKISYKVYGTGGRWNEIYLANKKVIANPGRIYAGQVLRIP